MDNMGLLCTKCNQGHYKETCITDDWDGTLHCDNCNCKIKRYDMKSIDNKKFSGKYCILYDENKKYYCIPIELKNEFDNWAWCEDTYDEEYDKYKYEKYIIDGDIRNYCFENFKK